MQKTIFVVDDVHTNLTMATAALEKQYRVLTMPSAERMFTLLEKVTPDLILLDIEMPEMNGFAALRKLKLHESHAGIPVIFLTGLMNEEDEVLGLELGAVDFITKPFSIPILQNRIKSHVSINELVKERTAQLQKLKSNIIFVLAGMIETRDENTGGHVERTSSYIKMLIEAMMENGIYADEMRHWNIDTVVSSAQLHDIGKIAIADAILNKPAKLTGEEFEIIKEHATRGKQVIDKIIARTGDEMFLHHAKQFAHFHHERWDGTGYPHGLKETQIPLQGRIMALVDVFDALTSERPYKPALPLTEAMNIIRDGAGTHFDPMIVDIFCKMQNPLKEVLYAQ